MTNADQMLQEATEAILAALDYPRTAEEKIAGDKAGQDNAFPPRLDDLLIEDLGLIRWRVLAPPAQVAAVQRCYGEAVATLLYFESDALAEGRPLAEDARRRMFIRSFKSRLDRVITPVS